MGWEDGKMATDSSDDDAKDGDVPGKHGPRINLEVLRGISLPGLEEIEVVLVRPTSTLARWTEGVTINVVSSGLVAVIAFTAGLTFADATYKTQEDQSRMCISSPAIAPANR
jgi:hypothetical protein